MASPAPESPKKRFSLRRTLSKRFSSHRGDRRQAAPLPDEKPLVVLRVQVLGCKDLAAADWNGKSDPYVVVTFLRQRQKTPVVHKNLSPTYNAKDATFDFPIYQSVAERLGTLLDIVVWDKDMLGKDYLAEIPIACSDWFTHNGGTAAYDFGSSRNKSFWLDLQSSKSSKEAKGSIHLKLGLVAPHGAKNVDYGSLYTLLVKKSRGDIFSAPATHGIGTLGDSVGQLNEDSDDSDLEDDDASAKTLVKSLPSFRLNWEGTKIDYSFSQHREIAGIILLEVRSANDLPKQKDMGKSGFECDPCAVINFGKRTARTRVIRHTLTPEWNEKLILVVPTDATGAKVSLSVLNWDTISGEDTLGEATLDVKDIIANAPKPDPRTGLYSPEKNIGVGMREFTLPLVVPKDAGLDTKGSPVLIVTAKFEPHAAFRQRFWRAHLHEFDKDKSGSFSNKELVAFLRDLGITLESSKIHELFAKAGKDADKDQLTLDEGVVVLETLIGVPPAAPVLEDAKPSAAAEAPKPATEIVAESPIVTSPVATEDPTTVAPSDDLFDSEAEKDDTDGAKPQDASWVDVRGEHTAAEPEKEERAEIVDVVPPTETAPPTAVVDSVSHEVAETAPEPAPAAIPEPDLVPVAVEEPAQDTAAIAQEPEVVQEEPAVVHEPKPVQEEPVREAEPVQEPQLAPESAPEPIPAPVAEPSSVEKPGKSEKPRKTKPVSEEKPKPVVPTRRGLSTAEAERAASYAALVLADSGLEISAERMVAVLNAAGIELDGFWATVFERAFAGKNVRSMLLSVGAGGSSAGAPTSAQVPAVNGKTEEEQGGKSDEAPAAPAEESDDDMGFGLFD